MIFTNSIIVSQLILLNGIVFIFGACCVIIGIILFIMTVMGSMQKKLTGTITGIKANMVSKIATLQVADEQGTREVEAELRSKSKVGDNIIVIIEKKSGKFVEFNPKRLMIVGISFIAVGLLIMLPGILMM